MRACLVLTLAVLLPAFLGADDPPKQDDPKAQLRQASAKGVAYLKSVAKEGNWEHLTSNFTLQYRGGTSCLALLALLESGVPVDDPVITASLDFVRKLKPNKTYIVALQTAVLAKAGRPEDKALLEENTAWLVQHANTVNGKINGWSYPNSPLSDNSNTHYAVLGLHAAAKAGLKVETETWQQIGDYYLRDQLSTGGWSYRQQEPSNERSTMISAGITGLSIVRHHLKEFAAQKAVDQGWKRLGDVQGFGGKRVLFQYYDLHALRRAGELSGRATLERGQGLQVDWYRAGVQELLRTQKANGSWSGENTYDGNPAIATSFALLFLADGEKLLK